MDNIPDWLFYLVAAVAGLELGGLSTIFIQRWIDEQPILKPGRSRCPGCHEPLAWRDTIPLLSYLLLRGHCRHCETPIGGQYMLVELSCLAWSLALAHHFGPTLSYPVYLVLGTMLIAGSFIDFETMLLPDRITIGGSVLALAATLVLPEPGWREGVIGAAVGCGGFLAIERLYHWRGKTGLGLGDVKLMAMIGAMVGISGLPLVIMLTGAASYLALGIMALRGSARNFFELIPFGPFLSLGCMLTVLYGEPIMRWLGMD